MHQDVFQYAASSHQGIVIPVAQYRVADTVQKGRSSIIVPCTIRMLPAVELHDQPSLDACKVDNVSAKWVLAPEFVPTQPPIAQVPPKPCLGIRLCLSQFSRFVGSPRPSPLPVPGRGRIW
jgi:hypothetical protein